MTVFIRYSSEQWIAFFSKALSLKVFSPMKITSVFFSACISQAQEQEKVEARETVSLLSIFDLDAEITQHRL